MALRRQQSKGSTGGADALMAGSSNNQASAQASLHMGSRSKWCPGFATIVRNNDSGCDAFASTFAVNAPDACMRRRGVIAAKPNSEACCWRSTHK